ncbi:DNA cytosine methyltransferase [Streptomyces sp. NBC_01373]|uniref:DNA cytosine methyltransferase n=1 Tax=Streptomyces sp. NBC_01373 TaxID=2903843 RepID=UPI0022513D5B|nr:DNA cytosine methyltransferase [Streptomyces sp. NBC_01373]MCX4707172.1 DNA cytosine methyltransferase [Streptomyces sp. NBC_01373]
MLTVYDEFSGVGGSSLGSTSIKDSAGNALTELIFAANHKKDAIEDHARNFPRADHFEGDVARADITTFPRADIFWASPSCPPWSNARGKRRDFDSSTQGVLFWEDEPDPETKRARALMEEVPRYLNAMILRGKPVLCGVVENVVECRRWDQWSRWLREIRCGGTYEVRVIAINSMHVRAKNSPRAPQSRNRLFVAYWLKSLGRTPDWNKWLRPRAYCPTCDATVSAMQVFKDPKKDMGTYGRNGQYWYRCPNVKCRNAIVYPEVMPASAVIDWSIQGRRIADRDEPLADATTERIARGIAKYATPFTVPAGGTWRTDPVSVNEPMPTRTTRETDGLAVPPLLVPTEGRDGKVATSAEAPMRTQTARNETGLAIPPFQISLRGGGAKKTAYSVDEPVNTVSASGNHHGLVTGQRLLIPYYSTGTARTVEEPVGTVTTRDRWSLAEVEENVDLGDVRFRMLEPHEIQAAMAFPDAYIVTGSKRDKVRKLGNAVTSPVAEVIVSALVEAVTGEPLETAW